MNAAVLDQNPEATEVKESKAIAFIHSVLDDYPLDPYEFRLFARIARRGKCTESLPNMAKACQMSLSRARKAIKLLKKCGLIEAVEQVGNSTIYWCKQFSSWINSQKVGLLRKELTPARTNTPVKSDTTSTPITSDTTPLSLLVPPPITSDTTPLSEVAHKGNPIKLIHEGNPIKGEEPPAPKIEFPVQVSVTEEKQASLAPVQNPLNSTNKCSAKLSQEEKLQELIAKYENGEVSALPPDELRMLANHFIGDLAKQYRKSGRILNPSPNDLNPDFKTFILRQDNKADPAYASRLITKIEHDPTRWSELSDFVAGWNLEKTGQINAEIPLSSFQADWDKCLSMASTNPSDDGLPEATKHALKAVGGFRGIAGCKPENLKFAQRVFADAWKEYQFKNNQ